MGSLVIGIGRIIDQPADFSAHQFGIALPEPAQRRACGGVGGAELLRKAMRLLVAVAGIKQDRHMRLLLRLPRAATRGRHTRRADAGFFKVGPISHGTHFSRRNPRWDSILLEGLELLH